MTQLNTHTSSIPLRRRAPRAIGTLIRATSLALIAGACLIGTHAAPGLPGASEARAQSVIQVGRTGGQTERVVLGLDKSLVIDLPADAHDILVANPEVADAVSRSARRIYLFGKKVGETNIFVFDRQGRQLVSLDLQVERDVAGLDRYLARFIPNSRIKTEIINDNIVLTGTVQTPQDAAQAAQLAEIFVSGGEATEQRDGGFFFFGSGGESQIVNLLEILGGDQVTLKVTVAEIQRSVVKQLGTSLSVTTNGDLAVRGFNNQLIPTAFGGAVGQGQLNVGGTIGSVNIEATLRALEEANVIKTLAEPNLTAASGETAIFRAGGEIRVPIDEDDDGRLILETIEFGVGLEFTPTVLSPGRISLQIRTAVSEPVDQTGLSLRKRLADTKVELPSGGTMMIAGLLRDDVRQTAAGFPVLSKVPILGALFRSQQYVRDETELVILITPYLARPVPAQNLARPTDNFAPPGDGTATLMSRVNRLYGTAGTAPQGAYHGNIGFIYK